MNDVPILDDRANCPGCGDDVWVWVLCDHDDPTYGPLCENRCCPALHGERDAA